MSQHQSRPSTIPKGYEPLALGTGYGELFGGMYRSLAKDSFTLGFVAETRHLNNFATCHGGAIAFVADMQLAAVKSLTAQTEGHFPTKQLTVDFIAPIRQGDWVEMNVELVRQTRTSIYTHGTMTVSNKCVARTTAIYHVPQNL